MNPFSGYGRIPAGNDVLEKHMKRLINNLWPEESVRSLNVTEKQFAHMKLLVGLPLFQEKKVSSQQMLLS
jgi:CRISPR-associated protein Cas2